MRIFRFCLVVTFLVGLTAATHGQCSFRPADCPVSSGDEYGSPDDSISRLSNPVLPLEITMENRLRRWTTDLMDRITGKEHWRYVELSEDVCSGARADDESVLAYPLRPPHWMEIHFQVIVNDDSLVAWRNWLTAFAQRRLDATMEYAKQQASETANPAKMATITSAAEKADKGFEAEMRRMTIHYHEASVLDIEFDFNMDYVKVIGAPPATALPLTISGTSTLWLNNPDPVTNSIDLFERCHTNAVLFAGQFKRTPDGQGYRPLWMSDKSATNFSTPKKIKSDQIQSIDCHFSGNVPAIHKALADFSPLEMSALIGHS